MKKIAGIAIAIVCIAMLTRGYSYSKEESISLYQRGLESINEIDYMAENEEVMKLMVGDKEVLKGVKEVGEYEYKEATSVYEVQNLLNAIFEYLEKETKSTLSQEAKDILREKVLGTFPSIINANTGAKDVVLSSILTKECAFRGDMQENTKTYIYTFKGAKYIFVVNFFNHGRGVVTSQTRIIVDNTLASLDKREDLERYIKKRGFQTIKLSEIGKK